MLESILSEMKGSKIEGLLHEIQGGQIVVWDQHSGPNQNWTFYPDGTIRSPSGLCLDISGGNVQKGTPIIAWPSNNGLNQKWTLRKFK